MRFREASTLVAYRLRWRILFAAVFFPSPLLIAVFRNSALEGWSVTNATTFALLLTVWATMIVWLISPIRHWRGFQVMLLAISCLLFRHLISGWTQFGTSEPAVLSRFLIVGTAATFIFIAAVRVRAPSEESVRLARSVDEGSFGGQRSKLIYVLGSLPWIVLAAIVLKSLFGAQG